jgi:hypothetical protein
VLWRYIGGTVGRINRMAGGLCKSQGKRPSATWPSVTGRTGPTPETSVCQAVTLSSRGEIPLGRIHTEATIIGTSKVKLSRYHHARDKGRGIYSSYSFLTSTLDGVSGRRQAPAALYPRYPLDRRLGRLQSRPGHKARGKILCLCQGSNRGHPVRSQTLYWATPAPRL